MPCPGVNLLLGLGEDHRASDVVEDRRKGSAAATGVMRLAIARRCRSLEVSGIVGDGVGLTEADGVLLLRGFEQSEHSLKAKTGPPLCCNGTAT